MNEPASPGNNILLEKRNGTTISLMYALIFFAALIIRLFFLYRASVIPSFLSPGMDAEIYRSWADRLLNGGFDHAPFFRAPFYPYLIAAIGAVFHGDTFWPIRILQILISSFAAVLTADLAEKLISRKAAWIAGLTWAFYSLSITFDSEGLITSIYTACFVLLIHFLYRSWQHPNRINLLLIGATLGMMTGLRANALVLWPVVLLFPRFHGRLSKKGHRTWRNGLLPVAVATLIVAPILAHNLYHGGGLTISTQGGINLYLGNHPGADGSSAVDPEFGNDWTQAQIVDRAERLSGRALTDGEVSSYYSRQAIKFWLDHPKDTLKLTLRKFLLLLNAEEIGNNRLLKPYLKEIHPVFSLLLSFQFGLVLLFGLPGLIYGWRVSRFFRPIILMASLHFLAVLPFFVNARYRFPVVPVLIIGTAWCVDYLWTLLHSNLRLKKKHIISLFIWILFAALVFLPVETLSQKEEHSIWYFHQGTAELRLEHWSEAIDWYRKTLYVDSLYRNAALNLGVCYLNLEQDDSAALYFRRELQNNPSNAYALNNLGILEEKRNNPLEAIRYYRKAYETDPTLDDARMNLAHLLRISGLKAVQEQKYDDALQLLGKAYRLTPELAVSGNQYSLILLNFGKLWEAHKINDQVLRQSPSNPLALQIAATIDSLESSGQ